MKTFLKFIALFVSFTAGCIVGLLWANLQIDQLFKKKREEWEARDEPVAPSEPTQQHAASERRRVQSITPETAEPAPQVMVFVTEKGQKYHRENCQILGDQKIARPLELAKEQYTPCALCNPPA